MTTLTPTEIRLKLSAAGFSPIPAEGKAPPMEKWQEKFKTTDDEIRLWPKTWHYAHNTGVLAKFTPDSTTTSSMKTPPKRWSTWRASISRKAARSPCASGYGPSA